MDVLLLRHGVAEARSAAVSGEQERQRRLTEQGRRRLRRGVEGLLRLLPRLDALATSSLPRASETAELVGARYGLKAAALAGLEPRGAHEDVAGWLAAQRADAAVMLVGHSPDLEQLAAWLLAGVSRPFLRLTRGGACLLHIESGPGPAAAELLWCLAARTLRELGTA